MSFSGFVLIKTITRKTIANYFSNNAFSVVRYPRRFMKSVRKDFIWRISWVIEPQGLYENRRVVTNFAAFNKIYGMNLNMNIP